MAGESDPLTVPAFAVDLFGAPSEIPARRIKARLARTLIADGRSFLTRDVPALCVTLDGIAGDRHAGPSRKADSRVPWYPRGTPIRNCRQLSLVAPDELAEIARRLGIAEVRPEWLGANLVIEGLARLTHLPVGTRLHLPGGAALVVEGENAPCRHAGKAVAQGLAVVQGLAQMGQLAASGQAGPAAGEESPPLETAFVGAARGLRGLVAWVERAGEIAAGSELTVKVPAQRYWEP